MTTTIKPASGRARGKTSKAIVSRTPAPSGSGNNGAAISDAAPLPGLLPDPVKASGVTASAGASDADCPAVRRKRRPRRRGVQQALDFLREGDLPDVFRLTIRTPGYAVVATGPGVRPKLIGLSPYPTPAIALADVTATEGLNLPDEFHSVHVWYRLGNPRFRRIILTREISGRVTA